MGTIIEQRGVSTHGWRTAHSALRLAVSAARGCLEAAGCAPGELDLLVNAGLYRDRNLAEPALAALIQEDVGANPEPPHADGHGTFSFDVANGTCGVLTALRVIDGFMHSGAIRRGLVVASDAHPGHGLVEDFPFAAAGGALLCGWRDDDCGLGRFHWVNAPDGGKSFAATVGVVGGHNLLTFAQSSTMDDQFAAAAAAAARQCLDEASMPADRLDLIVAAPARAGFTAGLADRLGVPGSMIAAAADQRVHTAALVFALDDALRAGRLRPGATALLVAAAAGVTAGAALYRVPPAG